jgi:GNAT superfamily N-acetyltransferase
VVQRYIDRYNPNNNLGYIKEGFEKILFFYVALDRESFVLVGLVRGLENRVVNLFVKGEYHRRGIGTKLMRRIETELRKRGVREIKPRASLYAVPFYQSLGYTKTTGIRNFLGLKIQPMKKTLDINSNKTLQRTGLMHRR